MSHSVSSLPDAEGSSVSNRAASPPLPEMQALALADRRAALTFRPSPIAKKPTIPDVHEPYALHDQSISLNRIKGDQVIDQKMDIEVLGRIGFNKKIGIDIFKCKTTGMKNGNIVTKNRVVKIAINPIRAGHARGMINNEIKAAISMKAYDSHHSEKIFKNSFISAKGWTGFDTDHGPRLGIMETFEHGKTASEIISSHAFVNEEEKITAAIQTTLYDLLDQPNKIEKLKGDRAGEPLVNHDITVENAFWNHKTGKIRSFDNDAVVECGTQTPNSAPSLFKSSECNHNKAKTNTEALELIRKMCGHTAVASLDNAIDWANQRRWDLGHRTSILSESQQSDYDDLLSDAGKKDPSALILNPFVKAADPGTEGGRALRAVATAYILGADHLFVA